MTENPEQILKAKMMTIMSKDPVLKAKMTYKMIRDDAEVTGSSNDWWQARQAATDVLRAVGSRREQPRRMRDTTETEIYLAEQARCSREYYEALKRETRR